MINRSLARVMATYSTRSSSDRLSRAVLTTIARLAAEGYRIRVWGSATDSPSPSSLSHRIWACKLSRLNFRDRPHRKTTGNSSPLDLWMLMIVTLPAFPEAAATAPLSSRLVRCCKNWGRSR